MTIKIIADGIDIPVRHIEFSDGCSNLVVQFPEGFVPARYINIAVDPKTPGDQVLFEVLLAVDAVARHAFVHELRMGLALPYLPHGRADRVFQIGNPFPLRAFLDELTQFFNIFHLTDPHSEYAREFLQSEGRKVEVTTQAECFKSMDIDVDEVTVLVAPDEGARKKLVLGTRELKWDFDVPVIQASKVRDVATGRVVSSHVECGDLTGIRCIIVDDISDGGGTFIPLAEKLLEKGADSVELYVTHGIFAKGLAPFKGIIDKIHVYQIVSNYITRADLDAFNSTITPRPL